MAKKKTSKPLTEHLEVVSETIIDRWGYTLFQNSEIRVDIESELDYGGCYYESDTPGIETKIIVYRKVWK